MDKIAKYYLSAESVILLGLFFAGLYDPSFLFFGVIYIGFALSVIGAIVSALWCIKRLRSGGEVLLPFIFVVGNIALFLGMLSFVSYLFSGGLRFGML